MDTISVTYVGDSDVINHISVLGGKKKKTNSKETANKLASTFVESSSNNLSKKSKKKQTENNEEEISLAGSIELLANNISNPWDKVYAFKTPKRSKQMSKYAAESARKIRGEKVVENQDSTKENLSPTKRITNQNKKYSVQHIEAGKKVDVSLNEEDSEETDSDDEEQEDKRIKVIKSSEVQECMSHVPSHRLQLPLERELYFDSHGGGNKDSRSSKTSDHTLQRLKNPRMGAEQLNEALKQHEQLISQVDGVKKVETSKLLLGKNHKLYFTKWMFYLCNNFNILLYGLGSKRSLIHNFCEKMLKSETKLVVNGFFPGLSIKSILTTITEDILKVSLSSTNLDVPLDYICQHYAENNNDHLFLIIHNIDGLTLRGARAQQIFSKLAEIETIHLISSIDHINAPLIWDQTQMARFRWLWYDMTTYSPYTEETSYEGSLLLAGTGAGMGSRGAALALSGLMHVARSLTSNARGVFRILAEHELAQAEEKGNKEEGEGERINSDFSFSDLYLKCRESFLVNSELTLRAHLTEFLDHRLVNIRKGGDGGEYLSVPLDSGTLKEYLEQDDV